MIKWEPLSIIMIKTALGAVHTHVIGFPATVHESYCEYVSGHSQISEESHS